MNFNTIFNLTVKSENINPQSHAQPKSTQYYEPQFTQNWQNSRAPKSVIQNKGCARESTNQNCAAVTTEDDEEGDPQDEGEENPDPQQHPREHEQQVMPDFIIDSIFNNSFQNVYVPNFVINERKITAVENQSTSESSEV